MERFRGRSGMRFGGVTSEVAHMNETTQPGKRFPGARSERFRGVAEKVFDDHIFETIQP